MARSTLKIISAASLAVLGAATAGVTYNTHSHFSQAIEQRVQAEKLSEDLQLAREKARLPEEQCRKKREIATAHFSTLKASPDRLYSSRVWLYNSGKNSKCGFFYPQGQGYVVVDPSGSCGSAIFHADAHKLYNDIMRFIKNDPAAQKIFFNMLSKLIDNNPQAAGEIYFSNFSRDGPIPSIGPKWGVWLSERAQQSKNIYNKLEYLLVDKKEAQNTKSSTPASQAAGEAESDTALYNAERALTGTGFMGTGTGVDITESQRDYFGRFVRALEDSAQAVSDRKAYAQLMREVEVLKKIHEWAKGKGADLARQAERGSGAKQAAKQKKEKPTEVETQFIRMRSSMQNALGLLRQSSPAAAAYLEDWLASKAMPGLLQEMFARVYEGMVMKHTGAPRDNKVAPDKEALASLLEFASHMHKKADAGEYKDNDGAMKVIIHLHRIVSHYAGSTSSQVQEGEATGLFSESPCFTNAESAIIAAEIEEVARMHKRNIDVLNQVPQQKVFHISYALVAIMLMGAAYLAYTSGRKDD
ncbi:MAG: hypothetical protein N3G76_02595 [Candidatus Micrarchaeota archaeon]|nr:hypothetical protein [Candidatus Micrarchaeota archaeon]